MSKTAYLDTSAFGELVERNEARQVAELMKAAGVGLVLSEYVAYELLQTKNVEKRTLLGHAARDLLGEQAVVAHWREQLRESARAFLAGASTFRPVTSQSDGRIRILLGEPEGIRFHELLSLRCHLQRKKRDWVRLQKQARRWLQPGLPSTTPRDEFVLRLVFETDVVDTMILGIVGRPLRRALKPRVKDFVHASPFCLCFGFQHLLAVFRHQVQKQPASAKKWPGFVDLDHAVYAGVCDYFVTEDQRLRKALAQQAELNQPPPVLGLQLSEYIEHLQADRVSSQVAGTRPILIGRHPK